MFKECVEVGADRVVSNAGHLGQFALRKLTIRGRQQAINDEMEALRAILHEIQPSIRVLVAELFRTLLRGLTLSVVGSAHIMDILFLDDVWKLISPLPFLKPLLRTISMDSRSCETTIYGSLPMKAIVKPERHVVAVWRAVRWVVSIADAFQLAVLSGALAAALGFAGDHASDVRSVGSLVDVPVATELVAEVLLKGVGERATDVLTEIVVMELVVGVAYACTVWRKLLYPLWGDD